MAEILPFRAFRFNSDLLKNLSNVIAPPYDVINDEMRQNLESLDRHNVVRLTLHQDQNQRLTIHRSQTRRSASALHRSKYRWEKREYLEAQKTIEDWIRNGILKEENSPCYYIYDQTFTTPEDGISQTRRALVAVGKIEKFGDSSSIMPHEKTLAAPKADRLELMRHTHANLSPIFMLYSDPEGSIEAVMKNFSDSHSPVIDIPERFGSTHRVWKLDDEKLNGQLKQAFEPKSLLIADGHHRYETALAFRDEVQSVNLGYNCNYVMMNLVRMETDGLVVLPIHRVLSGISPEKIDRAMTKLSENFELTQFSELSELRKSLEQFSGKSPAFGICTREEKYNLIVSSVANDRSASETENLDVSILHREIIEELFGLDSKIPEHQKQLQYKKSVEEAIELVRSGEGDVAFLMNPTPIEQVKAVAFSGETMPQKSTFFYPKLATGLTINLLGREV